MLFSFERRYSFNEETGTYDEIQAAASTVE